MSQLVDSIEGATDGPKSLRILAEGVTTPEQLKELLSRAFMEYGSGEISLREVNAIMNAAEYLSWLMSADFEDTCRKSGRPKPQPVA